MIHQDLFEKCRRASTREEQRKAWGDLIVFVGNESTSFAVKESIARTVLLEWPYSQVASSVDRVLDACGIVVSVSTCTSILKDLASNNAAASLTKLSLPSVLQACWTTLQRLILASRNEKSGESKTPLITEEADIIPYINTILLLPQVISNACHAVKVRVPLTATPTKFYPRLVECCFSNNEETPKSQFLYTKALMKSMLTSRRSDHVAMGLARQHPHLQLAKLDLSPRETSNLLLSMMQYFVSTTPQDPKVLKTCLKLIQSSSNEHIEAFVQVLVFSSKDPQYPPIIAQLLDQADGQCLYKHLCDVAEIWSQWSFCHERDSEHQHYVSQVLLCGLSRLGKENISDSDDLTLCLLQGVTHRLESFFPQTRKDGMRIAQQVAKRLGQDLQFDELEEEPQQKSDDAFIHEDSTVLTNINEVIPTKTSEPKKLKQKSISHKRDPDADYDSDDDEEEEFEDDTKNEEQSEGDNSTIWDEELVGYDLEDAEEDLVETRIPLHLLEALELLRTAENHENAYSRHETALQSLPDLIRKRPDDLPDVAVSLVLQLLRMENKFNISGFVESQHEAMLALTVNEPYSVGQCLIDRLFQDSCLSSRLSILATLQEAAYDLSGSKELDCRQAPNAQR